tara:strand:+ start:403 stop:510 length:108 start_codon:yes stop_codon:yes gene_type:complete
MDGVTTGALSICSTLKNNGDALQGTAVVCYIIEVV